MAQRRMFSKSLTDSDAFLNIPLSAQALYFHLALGADDDGFLGNCKMITRTIDCSEAELNILSENGLIIKFESDIVVIRHWKMHNRIRGDIYKKTIYHNEKALLGIDENGIYYMLCDKPEIKENNTVTVS